VKADQRDDQRRLAALVAALLDSDRLQAGRLLEQAGAASDPLRVAEHLVLPALEQVGEAWATGRAALSQVYMSGRICEALIDAWLPPAAETRRRQPKLAVMTLQDKHLLGKRLVVSVLRAAGYALLDYGSVPVEGLAQRLVADEVDVAMLSVLMLPSALRVSEVRRDLQAAGARTRLVVGGAPFRLDRKLWREVGADAMGRTASEAVDLVAAVEKGRL
jgi:methanogenic corrinoid protein MtbC1